MVNSDMGFVQKKEKDTWQTPQKILEPIQEYMGIDIDPCAGENTEIGKVNFRYPENNGLKDPWIVESVNNPVAFVNPPFSAKKEFIDKAIEEYKKENVSTVFILVPDSTDVKSWWHNKIAKNCKYTWFPRGRINYIDPKTGMKKKSVSFGSSLNILGDMSIDLAKWMAERGDLVKREYLNEHKEDVRF